MSLLQVYEAYLNNPAGNATTLSDEATLHYINTLTSIHTAPAIVKHNAAHDRVLKKKQQKVLDHLEGGNGLTVDVETTIEFISGGGAYLPGMDDNFVSDRIVTFPMVSDFPDVDAPLPY